MSKEITRIPLAEFSDNVAEFFARVVREQEPLIVEGAAGELAVLKPAQPAKPRLRRRKRTEADHEAFLSALGSWSDVDTDKLLDDIRESRSISTRPAIEL